MVASAMRAEVSWGQLLVPSGDPRAAGVLTYLLIQSEGIHCGWLCLVVTGEQPLSSTLHSPAPPSCKAGMLPLNTIVLSH